MNTSGERLRRPHHSAVLTEDLLGMFHDFHMDKNSITSEDLVQILSNDRGAEQRLETTLEATRKADMPHLEGMALNVRGNYMLCGVMTSRCARTSMH